MRAGVWGCLFGLVEVDTNNRLSPLSFPSMADPIDTIELLSGSIDELEECLEPLFQKTLSQTEENLEPAQKAKLQVLLSYVIQDLVLSMLG